MKIEHLFYLEEIAKSKTISAAAKKLYMGQTTLSAILKGIEEELGFLIFKRTMNGVVLTKEGEYVLSLSEDIIANYRKMLEVANNKSEPKRIVHLLVTGHVTNAIAPELLRILESSSKAKASLSIHDISRHKMLTSISEDTANIGIASYDHSDLESIYEQAEKLHLECVDLAIDRFYLCVSAKNPKYAKRMNVDLAELNDEYLVAPASFSTVPNGNHFGNIFRKMHRVATFPTNYQAKLAVKDNNYISFMTGISLANDPFVRAGELKPIEVSGFGFPNQLQIVMISRPKSSLSVFETAIYDGIIRFFQAGVPLPGTIR